jgi:hypothetical protein
MDVIWLGWNEHIMYTEIWLEERLGERHYKNRGGDGRIILR